MLTDEEIESFTLALIAVRRTEEEIACSSRVEDREVRSARIKELTRARQALAAEEELIRVEDGIRAALTNRSEEL